MAQDRGSADPLTAADHGKLSDWHIEPFLAEAIGHDAAAKELARMDEISPDGQTSFVLTPIGDQ